MAETKTEAKTNHWLIVLSEALLGVGGIFLIIAWRKLPPEIPWLYSQPWGEMQLIPKLWFGGGLVAVAVANLINLALSKRLLKNDSVTAVVIEGASLLLTVMYLAAFFRVISIIT